jgi:G:T-mismatch repair DNA endonuclease (very short patch repair protein)
MDLRYPWIASLMAAETAKELKGRRWVGRVRKKFRVKADPWINLKVRQLIHQLGYRYILFDERLPGSPHLVFPARKLAVFTVGDATDEFHGRPPNPSSRSNVERASWELIAVKKALHERGWRCEFVTSEDARTKRGLRRRVKAIFAA